MEQKEDKKKKISKKTKSYTTECLPQDKKMTSNGKSNLCDDDIQTVGLSKTLEVELTSNEKVLLPFWIDALKETYVNFILPTVTGCVDSGSIYYNSYSKNMESNYPWKIAKSTPVQNKNSQETFSALLMSLAANLLPKENTNQKLRKGIKRKGTTQENGKKQNKMSKLSQKQIERMNEKTLNQKIKFMGLGGESIDNEELKRDILELLYNDFIDERHQKLEQLFVHNPKSLKLEDKRDLCARTWYLKSVWEEFRTTQSRSGKSNSFTRNRENNY